MSRTIFVLSDHHLGHNNILNFTKDDNVTPIRPGFSSIDEMNEALVDGHNSVVNDNDIVYFGGDVFFGQGHIHVPRLKGRKRLIVGNHDDLQKIIKGDDKPFLAKHFQKIMMWRMFPEFNCVLTHVPLHETSFGKVDYNLHGHIHHHDSPTPFHVNCCVEHLGVVPKAIEELVPFPNISMV